MKRGFKILFVFLVVYHGYTCQAQSTFSEVYAIFQTNCTFTACHDNGQPALNFDLGGSGANPMLDVYENLINVEPANAYAVAKGYKQINPGDPNRSYLFRKINYGLDPTIHLNEEEMDDMPMSASLDEEEIELIRQWILFGAPDSTEVIDPAIIDEYYNNNGYSSIPNPPISPAEEEGFQIHFGPLFLEPASEDEVYIKYNLGDDDDTEVKRIDVYIGGESHHFILYKFYNDKDSLCNHEAPSSGDGMFADGYRTVEEGSHLNASLVVAAQSNEVFEFPINTAFIWEDSTVLDLNAHFINPSAGQVLAGEVYVNVYTQERGVAKQELKATIFPYNELVIPNDGIEYTFTHDIPIGFCYPNGIYVISMVSHSHALGVDYDLYSKKSSLPEMEHIYDASCFQDGVPGCETEYYDYKHPPVRTFEDFYWLSNEDTLTQIASYVNNEDDTVFTGLTSTDEMMISFIIFLDDTTGLHPNVNTTVLNDLYQPDLLTYPNPTTGKIVIADPEHHINELRLLSPDGRTVFAIELNEGADLIHLDLRPYDLPSGIYWLITESSRGGGRGAPILLLPSK